MIIKAKHLYFDGQYYNGIELTLYKVYGGNMSSTTISEDEFPE